MNNLWPTIEDDDQESPPVDILKEQADYIKDLTENLIQARVDNVSKIGKVVKDAIASEIPVNFAYLFSINSPYVNNYKRNLFYIFYDITFYPLYLYTTLEINDFSDEEYIEINNEQEFINLLKQIFNNDDVKLTIKNLKKIAKKEAEAIEDDFF